MTIVAPTQVLPTPPDQAVDDKPTFALKAYNYTVAWKTYADQLANTITQMNADIAGLNVYGVSLPLRYTFSTTTTDADPGNGFLRLSSATQNISTVIRMDLVDSVGNTQQGVLDTFDDSTSAVKGVLRIMHRDTPDTKFLVFTVTAVAVPAGYRNITATCIASSAANPFANNDPLVVSFVRAGDMGSVNEAQIQNQSLVNVTTGGTSTVYTATPTPAFTAYATGQSLNVNFHTACGAAPTLSISGLAALNLVKQNSDGTFSNLGLNDLPTGWRSRVTLVSLTQALIEEMPPAYSTYGTMGLVGAVNGVTPLTKYDIAADGVLLRDAATRNVMKYNTGTLTCDLGLAGPAANGRDQALAFSANVWVYIYFIWNGSTLATLASTTAPSAFTGSTLPTGYTHWCFATALRWNASSNIIPAHTRGARVFYTTLQQVVTNGTASTSTAVSVSGFVPPNALLVYGSMDGAVTSPTAGFAIVVGAGPVSGTAHVRAQCIVPTVNGWSGFGFSFTFQQVAQTLYYNWSAAPGAGSGANVYVTGYTVPNGGE